MSSFEVPRQALFDFEATAGSAKISLIAGEVITQLDEPVEGGWCWGKNSKGEEGYFPMAYVDQEVYVEEDDDFDESEWSETVDQDGNVFYYNSRTRRCTWTDPRKAAKKGSLKTVDEETTRSTIGGVASTPVGRSRLLTAL